MAGLLLVDVIVVNFLVHDCSAEFDMKEYLTNNPSADPQDQSAEVDEKTPLKGVFLILIWSPA